ncbi:MAG: hypothetical protein JWN20_2494, partial [Jatrophihabitantaceae bacterium]|nr:hypothetical protein [Jatrophihabitantaceae bacterium]
TYAAAPFAGVVDPENVLFYNLGGRSLSALSRAGIAFERSYAIPEPPLPIDAPRGMHHHRYEMTDPDDGPVHWSLGTRLASFDDVPVARVDKPGPIWAGIRRAASLPQFSEPDTGPLVVELMVSAPGRPLRSASTVLKTLLDGAISAFHAHSGAISSDLAARAAAACGVPGMDPAALSDVGWAALGSRAVLIRPFGPEGVQWNPADERCVATSVRLQGSAADRTRWLVSGRISAALPRP